MRKLVILLATVAAAAADGVSVAADRALEIFRAKGDLKEVAAKDDPDPWLVADELCVRGEFDAAEAFARAAPRPDVEKLPGFVASRRGMTVDAVARAAVKAANDAFSAKDFAGALRAIESAPSVANDNIAAIRLAYGRGIALRGLMRPEESAEALLTAGRQARELGWLARAGSAIHEAAMGASGRSDFRLALALWQDALEIAGIRRDRAGVAQTLGHIGNACSSLGDHRKALECHERGRKLWEEIGDRGSAAAALGNIGNVHHDLGNYSEALGCQEHALRVLEEIGDRVRIAATLVNTGAVHLSLGDYPKALQCHERALKLMEDLGDRAGAAATLGNIGLFHHALGDYAKALEHHERALKLKEEIGDRAGAAGTLGNIGVVHHDLGDAAKALEHYLRTLKLVEDIGDRAGIARTFMNIGRAYRSLGDYPKALEYHGRALKLSEELGDRAGAANTLVGIGNVHHSLGDYRKALEYQERSLKLLQDLGLRPDVAKTLGNIGAVHYCLGNYPKALAYDERSLKLKDELGDRAGAAATLGNIGNVHYSLGDYAMALEYHGRALKLMEDLGDRAGVAGTLVNIGNVRSALGDHPKALDHHERALKLMQELGDRAGVAAALGNVGFVRCSLGDYATALECHERALKLEEEIGGHAGVATSLLNVGYAHYLLGDHAKALDSAERARKLASELGSVSTEIQALCNLAGLQIQRGEPAKAAEQTREAIRRLTFLVGMLPEESGATAREQWAGLFDNGTLAALALNDAAEASFFLESGRAMTLLESLGRQQALWSAVVPEELRSAEAKARHAASAALALYRNALEKGDGVEALWKEVEGARGKVIDATRRVQREAKAQACVVCPEAAPLDRIRSTIRPDEALVTYALLKEDALALVVTHESAHIVRLGRSEAITKAASALHAAVLRPDERGVAMPPHERLEFVARRLRALVVEPLGLKDTKRLLVAPHGGLAYVPFALLAPGFDIVYVPSGTTYGVLLDDAALRGEGVLALGDPPAADPEAASVYRGGEGLAPLPASRAEAQAIGDIVLIGDAATETGLLNAVASRPRWHAVHLACHGLVRADLPELSCLALGADADNDGFLTVLEVFRTKIPADLVVLSACETAKGKVYKAEGVIGLTRAFMLAGSPRVICSLWRVDDAATRELMTAFYKEWKGGAGAAAALRKAQAHVASQEKWKDPYFWAAWQLWGLPE